MAIETLLIGNVFSAGALLSAANTALTLDSDAAGHFADSSYFVHVSYKIHEP